VPELNQYLQLHCKLQLQCAALRRAHSDKDSTVYRSRGTALLQRAVDTVCKVLGFVGHIVSYSCFRDLAPYSLVESADVSKQNILFHPGVKCVSLWMWFSFKNQENLRHPPYAKWLQTESPLLHCNNVFVVTMCTGRASEGNRTQRLKSVQ